MKYSDKLKHPLWQKRRLEILQRDSFTCYACKDDETTLHVHHLKYTTKLPHEEPSENLLTLCEHCHKIYEYYKKEMPPIESLFKLPADNGTHLFFVKCEGYKSIYLELYDQSTGDIRSIQTFYDKSQINSIIEYIHLKW